MDRVFNSVWALRIVALVLSLALFLYVKSELETSGREAVPSDEMDVLYNVPLEVYYDDEDLIVTGVPETVNVTISGNSKLILQTKITQDYVVFVDLNSLTIGEHHVTIQNEGFSEKLNVSIDPVALNISIEERVTREFRVEPEMNKRLIAEDYDLKGMTVDPTTVVVTGAKSAIENISYVKATVTGEQGIKNSFQQEANVKVLNAELNRLDVAVQPEKVKVKVEIEEYSRDVPIKIKQIGQLKDGISIEKLWIEPVKLKVYGKKAVIDELKELVVEFDVSDLEESGSYEGKIKVPEKVTAEESSVTIHADIQKELVETADESTEGGTGQQAEDSTE
ncbi:CdaR family protein [Lysinibacillus sp. KU-BSD001]|uniref:CdaR family protein n=1 Tax=Lysinibacillus sp. KU-BSD001 TaxID=3141328 RepID=UPI0036EB7AD5